MPAQDELIARVSTTYALAPIYSDTGEVEEVDRHGARTLFGRFSTSFSRRDDLFRFAFSCPNGDRYLVDHGVPGHPVLTLPRGPYDIETLDLAVAATTGITRGASHTIAKLLMPSISGSSLFALRESSVSERRHDRFGACLALDFEDDLISASFLVDPRSHLILQHTIRTKRVPQRMTDHLASQSMSLPTGFQVPDVVIHYDPRWA